MAAALSVDVEGWRREFDELMLRVGARFARVGARFARGRAAAADGRVLPAHAPHPVPLALLAHASCPSWPARPPPATPVTGS